MVNGLIHVNALKINDGHQSSYCRSKDPYLHEGPPSKDVITKNNRSNYEYFQEDDENATTSHCEKLQNTPESWKERSNIKKMNILINMTSFVFSSSDISMS